MSPCILHKLCHTQLACGTTNISLFKRHCHFHFSLPYQYSTAMCPCLRRWWKFCLSDEKSHCLSIGLHTPCGYAGSPRTITGHVHIAQNLGPFGERGSLYTVFIKRGVAETSVIVHALWLTDFNVYKCPWWSTSPCMMLECHPLLSAGHFLGEMIGHQLLPHSEENPSTSKPAMTSFKLSSDGTCLYIAIMCITIGIVACRLHWQSNLQWVHIHTFNMNTIEYNTINYAISTSKMNTICITMSPGCRVTCVNGASGCPTWSHPLWAMMVNMLYNLLLYETELPTL